MLAWGDLARAAVGGADSATGAPFFNFNTRLNTNAGSAPVRSAFCQARFVSCGYSRHAGEVRDPFGSRGRILIARIEDRGSWEGKAVLASGVLQARVAVFMINPKP